MDRRTLLAGLSAVLAQAQTPAGSNSGRGPVFQHDLPDLSLKDWVVTAVHVDYAPGGKSNAHRHPGITLAYVLEGEVASKVADDPEKTYSKGEMWIEYPHQLHAVSRNASATKPAKLLAILLAKKGEALTSPA